MTLGGSAVDWTQVLVALIAAVPAILATVFGYLIHRNIRTPSGERIGRVMEKTHDLSAADVALTTEVHRRMIFDGRHKA